MGEKKNKDFKEMPEYCHITMSFMGGKDLSRKFIDNGQLYIDRVRKVVVGEFNEVASCVMETGKMGTNPHFHLLGKIPDSEVGCGLNFYAKMKRISRAMYDNKLVSVKRMFHQVMTGMGNVKNVRVGYQDKEKNVLHLVNSEKLDKLISIYESSQVSMEQYLVRLRFANGLLTNEEFEFKTLYEKKEIYVDIMKYVKWNNEKECEDWEHFMYRFPAPFPIADIRDKKEHVWCHFWGMHEFLENIKDDSNVFGK